jgi:[ribosomal protein S5]-alanine N-acetyltransferase
MGVRRPQSNGSEMTDLISNGVRLVSAAIELLDLEDISGDELALALDAGSPPSWPPGFNDQQTRAWVRDRLRSDPQSRNWYSWYVIATVDDVPFLAGIAGYKGPPDAEGRVEIGYAVVPEYQRRGIATIVVDLLCQHAFASGVSADIAHTLPSLVPSQGVLGKAGFGKVEVLTDPDEGEVWRYQLNRP